MLHSDEEGYFAVTAALKSMVRAGGGRLQLQKGEIMSDCVQKTTAFTAA